MKIDVATPNDVQFLTDVYVEPKTHPNNHLVFFVPKTGVYIPPCFCFWIAFVGLKRMWHALNNEREYSAGGARPIQ